MHHRDNTERPVYAESASDEAEIPVPELASAPIKLVASSWRLRRNGEKQSDAFVRAVIKRPGAVAVLGITDEDEVVFVRQFRAALGDFVLELPAGLMDVQGEPPETTAKRELLEETGYSAERVDILNAWNTSPGFTNELITVYTARGLTPGERDTHGPEEDYSSVELIPVGDAVAMAMDGRLADMKSAAAILTARAQSVL